MPTIKNKNLVKKMESMGFNVSTEGRFVNLNCNFGAVNRYVESREEVTKLCDKYSNEHNIENYLDDPNDNDFSGCTPKQFYDWVGGKIPLEPYEKKRQELVKKGLTKRLNASIADVTPKRKRRMSEHDGEWSYDRRWEIEPFSSSVRTKGAGRIITLNCHFAFSARNDPSKITQYGAFVWALSKIIEDAGIQTKIIYHKGSRNCDTDRSLSYKLTCVVKEAGEYITPNHLAFIFSAPFYRRFGFSLINAACDMVGKECSSGLGQPIDQGTDNVKFENGALTIGSSSPFMEAGALEKELLAAIAG